MAYAPIVIKRIDRIEAHPTLMSNQVAVVDGLRFEIRCGQYVRDDLVAHVPEGAKVPEWMLQHLRLWDEAQGKGTLHGPAGDWVPMASETDGLSSGLLYPVQHRTGAAAYSEVFGDEEPYHCLLIPKALFRIPGIVVYEGLDIGYFLRIELEPGVATARLH